MLGTYYLARRSAESWGVDALDPPQSNPSQGNMYPTLFAADDLSKVLQFSRVALTPGAIDGGGNLYFRDSASGLRTLAVASSGGTLSNDLTRIGGPFLMGGSSDLAHVAFNTREPLVAGVPSGVASVYEIANGEVRLVSRLPDNSPNTGEAIMGALPSVWNPRPVSDDGSRVYFVTPADFAGGGPLYLRESGTTTTPISVSRRPGDPTDPQSVRFIGASSDGSVVYFLSTTPLTPDGVGGALGELYRYDLATDDLRNVSPLSDPAYTEPFIRTVSAVSPDGADVYFTAEARLTSDAVSGGENFYVNRDGALRLVAILDSSEFGPANISMSPNSRYLAFSSTASLTGYDNRSAGCSNGVCLEVYLYDREQDAISCLSCAPVDDQAANSDLALQIGNISEYVPRSVTNEGTVFFNTRARLVADDVNGRVDVYELSGGRASLISSGRSTSDSTFADATEDGASAFFFTAERLVRLDKDDAIDVYDARVGGGLVSQQREGPIVPECQGDGCQGPASEPFAPVLPGSALIDSPDVSEDAPSRPSAIVGPKRVDASSARFAIRGSVTAAGVVSVSGRYVRAARKSVSRSGRFTLSVVATRRAQRLLRSRRSLSFRVRLSFAPRTGRSSSVVVPVSLRRKG